MNGSRTQVRLPGGVPSVTPLHLPIPRGNNAHTVWVEKPTAAHKSRSSREPERALGSEDKARSKQCRAQCAHKALWRFLLLTMRKLKWATSGRPLCPAKMQAKCLIWGCKRLLWRLCHQQKLPSEASASPLPPTPGEHSANARLAWGGVPCQQLV